MRAYLFDTTSGLYEGETFEEAQFIRLEEGLTSVPAPYYTKDLVPVFDAKIMNWLLVDRAHFNSNATSSITMGANGSGERS
jgi:hypothetical protein